MESSSRRLFSGVVQDEHPLGQHASSGGQVRKAATVATGDIPGRDGVTTTLRTFQNARLAQRQFAVTGKSGVEREAVASRRSCSATAARPA